MATACPHRYIERGRTFCRIAILERKYCTNEVEPPACEQCAVPGLLDEHPCANIDLGVEIDEYGGHKSVERWYASCRVTVERIERIDKCTAEECPHWKDLANAGVRGE
ncbi:MAG: hypothetical protein PVH68_12135 [Armatimonadota bacterium]